ncbi:acetyl-CoA acetyltransferase [Rhodococcus sp. HNM0569]|uniref:acetyl-CoA acetyltransferase n=1 Tax=Rhodococcus sp. HNM0569 TaxID=2716340 RepID=UPI00146C50D8|nr:acetyl-CoA acetyltransferase [Rhodococcus sp. HNM0569]NLU83425.1 acetyl-CoA acetyltransferase [Rhodococcus sp. HNM0569]
MTSVSDIDPRTPVVVGVGQFSERVEDPGYRALSSVDLAAHAVREALSDTGADAAAVASAVDTVAGVRQFEISVPGLPAPLGKSNNFPRSVAQRVGTQPARAILEVVGGQGPQHLVTELASAIAHGDGRVAVVFGSEAISTARHFAAASDKPDFDETVDGDLEDRGHGIEGLMTEAAFKHGLVDMPSQYALIENARRARLGVDRAEYARSMGELFAPFTRVAARNPHSSAPTERTAEELTTPSDRNRPITDPYTRFVVARDQVNQGAAVIVTSVEAARELGVPQEKWVFLHGHADLRERDLFDRQDMSSGPASVMAARHALEVAGLQPSQLTTLDLYSCFPIAVSNIADSLELSADDPRGLTVTGGLPFFGGAGNNYSMHAIAETVALCRSRPGAFGFVGANGGTMSKYSAGIYSTTPAPWRTDRSDALQAEVDAWPAVPNVDRADGWATIETYTVKHDRSGARTGIVVGRLDDTHERFVALGTDEDDEILTLLTTGEPIGKRVYVRSFDHGNRVATSDARMDELHAAQAAN